MAAADKDKMRGLLLLSSLDCHRNWSSAQKAILFPCLILVTISHGPPAVRASISSASVVHLYRPLPTQCMHKLGMGMDFKGRIGFFVRAHFSLELR